MYSYKKEAVLIDRLFCVKNVTKWQNLNLAHYLLVEVEQL